MKRLIRVLAVSTTLLAAFTIGVGGINILSLQRAYAQNVTATYGPAAGGNIPDNNAIGVSSTINTGTAGLVVSLNNVTITGLTHTWMSDLTATLTHGSTSVNLFARPGDDSDFGGNYTFQPGGASLNAAATTAGDTTAIPSGTYAPSGNFAAFVGAGIDGNWTLKIADTVGADVGSFVSWQFNATYSEPLPPPINEFGPGAGGNIADANDDGTTTGTPVTTTSDIVVTENLLIQDFQTVTIDDLQHTLAGDLRVQILHVETGTLVDLFNRPGHTTSDEFDFGDDSNLSGDYTFGLTGADFGAALAGGNTSFVLPSGSYAASSNSLEPNATLLSAFNGQSTLGTWRLLIRDSVLGDIGSFSGWRFNAGDNAIPIVTVPEPGTFALFGAAGLLAIPVLRRRKAVRA